MKKIIFFLLLSTFTISVNAQYRNYPGNNSKIKSPRANCNITASIDAEWEKSDGTVESDLTQPIPAPAKIHFYGIGNDSVEHYKWYIIQLKGGNEITISTSTQQDYTYTFYESGSYRIKLEAGKLNSDCVVEVFRELTIPESELDVPNFFSPQSSPGVNDEFRVAYKSIVKFKATIFNRWGVKLYEWRDPDRGWDGRYKGRYVKPGVYFYVIEATGSDGIKYVKKGDINIL